MSSLVAVAIGATAAISWSAVALTASIIYQQHQAGEMRRKRAEQEEAAAADADAAKGIQIQSEETAADVSVIYGRNLVGGQKVYHNTFSNYNFVESPVANFPYVAVALSPETAALDTQNTSGWVYLVFSAYNAGSPISTHSLGASAGGTKHEYLITQQVIGLGGVSRVWNVLVNDRRIGGEWINSYNEVVPKETAGATFSNPLAGTARVNICTSGSVADPLLTANDASRSTAVFTNMAYATCVFKLNRDDPQYNGPPSVQFLVEGIAVAPITGTEGARTLGTKTYSNNPALIALDYLTNTIYGKGISLDKIDLDTFYEAARICDRVVVANATVNGSLWELGAVLRPIGTENITTVSPQRPIKLYECNLSLSTAKPIRDNLSSILETMNDVSLIWSGGKYKMILDYPTIYSAAVTYTAGDKVQIGTYLYKCIATTTGLSPLVDTLNSKWVTAFRDVTDDNILRDAEVSINWPSAQVRLNFATVKYLNESKDFAEDTVTWPPKSGPLYASMLAEDSGVQLETETFATGITTSYGALAKAEYMVRSSRTAITYELSLTRDMFDLEPGDMIRITSQVLNIPGDLVRITELSQSSDGSFKISGVRFDANSLAWNANDLEPTIVRRIYNEVLEQATGLAYSNASAALKDAGGVLTWNYPSDNRVISFDILYATGTIDSNTVWKELGKVSRMPGVTGTFNLPVLMYENYSLTVVSSTLRNTSARTGWPVLSVVSGLTTNPTPQVVLVRIYKKALTQPAIPVGGVYNFAARTLTAYDAGWSLSVPSGAGDTWASDAVATSPTGASSSALVWGTPVIYLTGNLEIQVPSSVLGVSQRSDGVLNYNSATGTLVLLSGGADVTASASASFVISKMTDCQVIVDTSFGAGRGKYTVTNLSRENASFVLSATYNGVTATKTFSVKLAGDGYVRDTQAPITPTGISINTTSTVLLITQTQPTYTTGRGHLYTEVWSAVGLGASSGAAVKVDEFSGNFYTIPVAPGYEQTLFFKWVSYDKGISAFSTGLNSTALKINGVNIVANSITSDQIAAGAIVAGSAIISDGAITNAKIGNEIRSDVYTAGVNGWKISKNGDIELNSAVFRGTLSLVGAGSTRMDVTNNKISVYDNNILVVRIGDLS